MSSPTNSYTDETYPAKRAKEAVGPTNNNCHPDTSQRIVRQAALSVCYMITFAEITDSESQTL